MNSQRLFRIFAYLSFVTFALCMISFFAFVASDTEAIEGAINVGELVFVSIVLFVFPLLSLIMGATGLVALRRNARKRKKRHDLMYDADNARMDDILQKLSVRERDYLQQQLQASRMGLVDDGEIVALDQLLDDDGQ